MSDTVAVLLIGSRALDPGCARPFREKPCTSDEN